MKSKNQLVKINLARREFNPSNEKDVQELRYFMKNNKWKKACPFEVQFPYADVPAMCKDKYIKFVLNIK